MKLNCAILDDYQHVAEQMADWSVIESQVNIDSYHEYFEDRNELIEAIQDYEILVIMRERTKFPEDVLRKLPNLKLLITTGMRNASIDLKAAGKLGITVCGTRGKGAAPTELTWALILGLSRHLIQENESFRNNGAWQSTIGIGLQGKTLGLLGLGKIGQQMATIGQAMGMNILAWSENLTAERAEAAHVQLAASKEELLAESDFLSIHLVLSDRTRRIIGKSELALMKPSAYLINTSRAGIVDQTAMIEALQDGTIAGAGLDVFDTEPLPSDHILRKLHNVLATPHIGYVSDDNYKCFYKDAVDNIVGYLNNDIQRELIYVRT
ncbi:D-2-hydroxyacid dehydrogenase family protein [Paenibacillus sp. PsM32]|uniref:D-2-hydroxyacid dehydrogenase family protein n=1 Tax=Paenibacillus sp. PsM32 TaxID=3030536 RepID=UPI00263AFCE4|nr:D-2-hydroxyacid dehydrogenase family protein [Paenibacillus sp. PsM32]MDN4620014.1 D-2-hydroxyacid dehydrogenase family protein [Paenibacillus sp. PsM32]